EASIVFEPADADEKSLGPCAAAEPRCLQVEEDERRTRRFRGADEGRFMRCGTKPARQIANGRAAVASAGRRAVFDDEAAVDPFAAEDAQVDVDGSPDGGHDANVRLARISRLDDLPQAVPQRA